MENEVWKDVVGFEGYYQVSNLGNVRSVDRYVINRADGRLARKKSRLITKLSDKSGYLLVRLYKEHTCKRGLVHRLVAKAFIPNHDNLEQVNHKNEVKADNNVENLEWMSRLDNVRYGTGIKRGRETFRKNNNIKPVMRISQHGVLFDVKIYLSATAAEKGTGVHHAGIKRRCDENKSNRKTRSDDLSTKLGLQWQYLE